VKSPLILKLGSRERRGAGLNCFCGTSRPGRAIDAAALKALSRGMVFAAARQQQNPQRRFAAVLARGHREET
jgi:hypothetical protein